MHVQPAHAIWLLSTFCTLYQKPIDPASVARECIPPLTEIGERGAGLSGGQRQRLAIARALLKGPKILIFDEATSSLDQHTAEQIGRTVNALKGKVTILFIAHALPKTLQPDQIVRIGERLTVVPAARAETQEGGSVHDEQR